MILDFEIRAKKRSRRIEFPWLYKDLSETVFLCLHLSLATLKNLFLCLSVFDGSSSRLNFHIFLSINFINFDVLEEICFLLFNEKDLILKARNW